MSTWMERNMQQYGDRGQVDPAYEAFCSGMDGELTEALAHDQDHGTPEARPERCIVIKVRLTPELEEVAGLEELEAALENTLGMERNVDYTWEEGQW